MVKKKLDVILIGGGHNGLVAAAYLAKAGKQDLVLERAEQVGGILRSTCRRPGSRRPGSSIRSGVSVPPS
jgi:phytoene dehydrogenase-like protein